MTTPSWAQEWLACVIGVAGADAESCSLSLDEVSLLVPRARIVPVLTRLRDDAATKLTQLMDLCAVDYPHRSDRFDVVYHLLSMEHNRRLRVRLRAADGVVVPSVAGVFSAAGWFEREAWDLFGIPFGGHPDLRRLLTDYGFDGHPLRKDFPLMGRIEARYDEAQQRVVYEPLSLRQDYRSFDTLSPWEGMTPAHPDDRKDKGGAA